MGKIYRVLSISQTLIDQETLTVQNMKILAICQHHKTHLDGNSRGISHSLTTDHFIWRAAQHSCTVIEDSGEK